MNTPRFLLLRVKPEYPISMILSHRHVTFRSFLSPLKVYQEINFRFAMLVYKYQN